MKPSSCAVPDTTFFEWLDNLSDAEHAAVAARLREIAAELGVRVDRKSTITHNLLNLEAHRPTVLSLN
jgi:hypothetical protein